MAAQRGPGPEARRRPRLYGRAGARGEARRPRGLPRGRRRGSAGAGRGARKGPDRDVLASPRTHRQRLFRNADRGSLRRRRPRAGEETPGLPLLLPVGALPAREVTQALLASSVAGRVGTVACFGASPFMRSITCHSRVIVG